MPLDVPGSASGPDPVLEQGIPDREACAREPIHTPGCIQPDGALIAFDPLTGAVVQASTNLASLLPGAVPVAGSTLARLFGAEDADLLLQALAAASGQVLRHRLVDLPASAAGTGRPALEVVMHAHAGLGFAELYPPFAAPSGVDGAQVLGGLVDDLNAAGSVEALTDTLARWVKRLSGFDRVMAYRFDTQWHGEVIADHREPGMESLLGLHYPADDIPAQARALYCSNLLRLISDVDQVPVPVLPWPGGAAQVPLDLSHAQLRSVSPVHLQYLHHMGVRASLSLSLMVEGRLWGLLVCHHRKPASLPNRVRHNLLPLTVTAGFMIAWALQRRHQEALATAARARRGIAEALADIDLPLAQAVRQCAPALTAVTGATGGVLWHGSEAQHFGDHPAGPAAAILAQARARLADPGLELCQTDQAWPPVEPALPGQQRASGWMALALAPGGESGIAWWRPEQRRETAWGGDPDQPVTVEQDAQGRPRLAPRTSFARWVQLTEGRCRAWSDEDVESARSLAALRPLLMLRERQNALLGMQGAMRELAAIQHEEVARLAQSARSALLRNVGHELRTPLNAVQGYAHLLLRDLALPAAARRRLERIRAASDWMLEMVTDLMDMARLQSGVTEVESATVDASVVVQEVVAEMRPLAEEAGVAIVVEGRGPLPVLADGVRLRRVLRSLASNGIKYNRPGGELRFVLVDPVPAGPLVSIEVRDTGAGLSAEQLTRLFQPFDRLGREGLAIEGTGLGLAISRQLVDAMHGRLSVTSEVRQGSCFVVELPRAPGAPTPTPASG